MINCSESEDAKASYRSIIENVDNLPSFPAIVAKLLRVVNSIDSSADDAAMLIQKDPALTSKMIRLANSAFYGIPRSISSVNTAVVILGFNTIRSLVLSATVMKMFSGGHQSINKEKFWKHSVVCAMCARTIVRYFMHIRMMDPESAFCAGILHDIGKLIFNECINSEYVKVCEYARANSIPLIDAETKILGINHAQIGKILADKWALPLDLEYSLVYHHNPDAVDNVVDLVTTVHLADVMAHQLEANLWDGEFYGTEWEEARAVLKITESDYEKIINTLSGSLEKSDEFLDIIS